MNTRQVKASDIPKERFRQMMDESYERRKIGNYEEGPMMRKTPETDHFLGKRNNLEELWYAKSYKSPNWILYIASNIYFEADYNNSKISPEALEDLPPLISKANLIRRVTPEVKKNSMVSKPVVWTNNKLIAPKSTVSSNKLIDGISTKLCLQINQLSLNFIVEVAPLEEETETLQSKTRLADKKLVLLEQRRLALLEQIGLVEQEKVPLLEEINRFKAQVNQNELQIAAKRQVTKRKIEEVLGSNSLPPLLQDLMEKAGVN